MSDGVQQYYHQRVLCLCFVVTLKQCFLFVILCFPYSGLCWFDVVEVNAGTCVVEGSLCDRCVVCVVNGGSSRRGMRWGIDGRSLRRWFFA